MKKSIDLSEAIGKTLKSTSVAAEYLLLDFGDAYVALDVERGYEDDVSVACNVFSPQQALSELGWVLVSAGIATEKEFEELKTTRDAENRRIQEQRERAHYMRLKAKFEQS